MLEVEAYCPHNRNERVDRLRNGSVLNRHRYTRQRWNIAVQNKSWWQSKPHPNQRTQL